MRLIDADALQKEYMYEHDGKRLMIIDVAPTIEPEQAKGEWIEDGYNNYKAVCSECGEPCATYVMGKPRDNFCKWCGADMRGDNE